MRFDQLLFNCALWSTKATGVEHLGVSVSVGSLEGSQGL